MIEQGVTEASVNAILEKFKDLIQKHGANIEDRQNRFLADRAHAPKNPVLLGQQQQNGEKGSDRLIVTLDMVERVDGKEMLTAADLQHYKNTHSGKGCKMCFEHHHQTNNPSAWMSHNENECKHAAKHNEGRSKGWRISPNFKLKAQYASLPGNPNTQTGNTRGAFNSYNRNSRQQMQQNNPKQNKQGQRICMYCNAPASDPHVDHPDERCPKRQQQLAQAKKDKRAAEHQANMAASKLQKTQLDVTPQGPGKKSAMSQLLESTNEMKEVMKQGFGTMQQQFQANLHSHNVTQEALLKFAQGIFPTPAISQDAEGNIIRPAMLANPIASQQAQQGTLMLPGPGAPQQTQRNIPFG